ncbi:MAG: PEP-CTERM sorting domain-containing protein [Cyanobacteria bacterium SBLK]|nr:PEP-CTERM sorting domain-containing protein [Cyanobacteria bacterium SBLK]
MKFFKCAILSAGILTAMGQSAIAGTFGGVEFSQGEISFADNLVEYNRGSGVGSEYRLAEQALGIPDYARRCRGCDYVSLGNGGSLVLEFTDNYLTGSDDNGFDLWVFEIGTAVEATFVEISKDGNNWFDVGKVEGATSGVDLDAFGFGTGDLFSFVRLTDDPIGAGRSYPSAGADIDAVGAISTIAKSQNVPEPSGLLGLIGLGLVGLFGRKRDKK